MQILKPPAPLSLPGDARVIFLAGSIEMGAAVDWQSTLTTALTTTAFPTTALPTTALPTTALPTSTFTTSAVTTALHGRELVILNPRRDEWDASWRQSIDEPRFRGQVEWELDGLDRADVIAMWFAPDTKAPVTLLELGLHARGGKLVVGCPDGYWRKGNVEVVCARHAIPLAGDWRSFVAAVERALSR